MNGTYKINRQEAKLEVPPPPPVETGNGLNSPPLFKHIVSLLTPKPSLKSRSPLSTKKSSFRHRRQLIRDRAAQEDGFEVLWIESICEDLKVQQSKSRATKKHSLACHIRSCRILALPHCLKRLGCSQIRWIGEAINAPSRPWCVRDESTGPPLCEARCVCVSRLQKSRLAQSHS